MTCKYAAYRQGKPYCTKGYQLQLKKCMGVADKLLPCYKEREKV